MTSKSGAALGVALFAVAMLGGASGCGATTAGVVSPRLAVQQERAVIAIDGHGLVAGGAIACGPRAIGNCEGEFDDLWATHLVAKPAPGWTFTGWKRDASPSLSPGFGGTKSVRYTAKFERDVATVATAR